MLRWGATREEAAEALPGDELTPKPRVQSTRAITIEAPPERVWPWIVQMGIERGGFYTHDWFERLLFHARYVEGRHSATRIHPELQELKVGDLIPYGGGAFARVHEIEPYRHLVAGEAFVLRRLPGERTRLIVRCRGIGYISAAVRAIGSDAPLLTRALAFAVLRIPGVELLARAVDLLVGDPLHHYMEIGMLRGTKLRAESPSEIARAHLGRLENTPTTRLLAGRQRSRRWMYRGGRPNAVARALNRATVALVAAGLSPRRLVVLEVEGRRTRRRVSVPVVVADLDGERYLVSMLGQKSQWIRNVRAAGGRAVIHHGRRQAVHLEEVPQEARAAVLKRYLAVAPGARAHLPLDQDAPLSEFERVAACYPVLRIGCGSQFAGSKGKGDQE
jgi:deazaflavin-dependent oxidoreductase (nitroreductase family)